MTIHRFSNTVLKFFLCGLGFTVLALPVPCCSGILSIDYSLGFAGFFQVKKWTPLTVVLENRGKTISGTLEVVVTSGSEYRGDVHPVTYSIEVELPYNSRKRCPFTVLIHSTTHEMIIRFRKGERIFISNSYSLRSHDTTKNLAIVLDPSTSPDFLTALPDRVFPVLAQPEFLPETWYGYDGVRMIILYAGILKRLGERQFQALDQWIKKGGYLVAAVGANYGSLLTKRMKHLLPMTIAGHRQFLELNALEKFSGRKLEGGSPFLVLDAKIENAAVLLEENGLPIVVEKKIGNGKIIFLSFDIQTPPFSRWDKRRVFWDKILSLHALPENEGIEQDDQKILDTLLSGIHTKFPRFWLSCVFLSAYLSLTGFLFKRLGKQSAARWKNCLYLVAVVGTFSAASFGLFFYSGSKKHLTYNSFFQVNISGRNTNTTGKYIIGLYSVKNTAYHMRLGPSSHPTTHLLYEKASAKIPNPYVLTETRAGQKVEIYSKRWSHSFFVVSQTIDFPIRGEALLGEQDLQIIIENLTPYTIKDCLLYFDNRFLAGGDIVPNKRQMIKFARRDIKVKKIYNDREAENLIKDLALGKSSSFLNIMQSRIAKNVLFSVQSKYKSRQNALHLTGWIPSGIITPRFNQPGITGEGLTLINWEIKVKMV